MIKIKRAVAIVSVGLLAGAAAQANAAAVARSYLDITNFVFNQDSGGGVFVPLTAADFSSLSFQETLTNTSLLNGVNGPLQTATGAVPPLPFPSPLNALASCIGTCAYVENSFAFGAGPPPTSTFAVSDSLTQGAAIAGLGPATPAHAQTFGETALNQNGTGSSGSSIILDSSLNFVLDHPIGSFELIFNASKTLQAWTNSPVSASATATYGITLTDGLTGAAIVVWNPNGIIDSGSANALGLTELADGCQLNQNTSAGTNNPNPAITCVSSLEQARSAIVLLADHPYSLAIRQQVQTQAFVFNAAPEPGSLALLGSVLLGFGAALRRKPQA